MRIAVTGAAGLVGRGVVDKALAEGHEVVGIVHKPADSKLRRRGLTTRQAELTDFDQFAAAIAGCEALIHLAAIPSPRRHPDHVVHNNNVVSNYNALSAATNAGMTKICLASSINATGAAYSRDPHYDYFPLDEQHPTYNEDPYALSKWAGEQQADSFARRYDQLTIASLRLHWVVAALPEGMATNPDYPARRHRDLWGYTLLEATARACLLALAADYRGHEVFYIVAPDTGITTPSLELRDRYYPAVPLRDDLSGNKGFYNCDKARRLLGWEHNEATET